MVAEHLFREHEARYIFAGRYVKGMRVLDVACGSGIGTRYLLKAGAQSCLGLDIDNLAIAYARAVYGDCVFAQCDATHLCLRDDAVDVVVSFETIEHVKDQVSFLGECKRVLRPGGILLCSTPNRTISRWGQGNRFHSRELTIQEFRDLIGSAFVEVRLYAQENRIYPLHAARIVLSTLRDRLALTGPLNTFLRRRPATEVLRTEFGVNSNRLYDGIEPYYPTRLIKPIFAIAAARKPLR
jgi:SAM-dependent methyltransferase